MTSLFCDKKETDLTGSYTDYWHNSHAKVPPVNVGGAIRGVFFIGSDKGIALSEIYGRYLILVKCIIMKTIWLNSFFGYFDI